MNTFPFRELNGTMKNFGKDLTVEICDHHCSQLGFKYFGLQHASECFCGNTFGQLGISTNCNMQCPGNSQQICGAAHTNSIYSTSLFNSGNKLNFDYCLLNNNLNLFFRRNCNSSVVHQCDIL